MWTFDDEEKESAIFGRSDGNSCRRSLRKRKEPAVLSKGSHGIFLYIRWERTTGAVPNEDECYAVIT